MAQQKQNINEEIDHLKEAFYSNGFTFWLQGAEAVIDFRQTLPRNDFVGGNNNIFSIAHKHQAIIMSPQTAKMISIILHEQLAKFEKENGEIKLPENWKAKPKTETQTKEASSGTADTSYIR